MYNDVITLVHTDYLINAVGDSIPTEVKKDVFALARSIGMKEKYEALAIGLHPELAFVLADYYDYDGQEYIEYEGVRYRVLRTFKKTTNELEIVVTR